MTQHPPGRPTVGPAINIRIPADLLSELDIKADNEGITRAQLIRKLLRQSMTREQGHEHRSEIRKSSRRLSAENE